MKCCQFAIKMAGEEKAMLEIFHIYPDQLMIPDSSFPVGVDSDSFVNADFIAELRKQSQQSMEQFITELKAFITKKSLTTISVKSRISGGDPEWEIQDVIREIKPDFIVMGTSGDGKKGFLEGNVAAKIMNKTSLPVFVVPYSTGEISFDNVMYATNLDEKDIGNLKLLFHFFDDLNSRFHIVHFNISGNPEDADAKMDALKNTLKKELPSININYHIFEGEEKDDSLKTFVETNRINMISFLTHKKSIFKKLFSHKINKEDFFKLKLPIMAIHEES